MTKVQVFFYKIFEEFNNDLYLWRSEVTTIKKGKIFNISLLNMALPFLQSLIPTCTIHWVNLMVFLYLALNLETYLKKCDFFGKIHFVILFCTRSWMDAILQFYHSVIAKFHNFQINISVCIIFRSRSSNS